MSRVAQSILSIPVRAIHLMVAFVVALGLCFVLATPAQADLSNTPDETWVTDGRVNSMVQAGDRVYLGGNFREVGPNVGFGAALSPTNFQREATFPKVDGKIWSAISDGKGGWYIGGDFSKVGTSNHSRLAHVLADGQVDSWNPGEINNSVRALALSPDGKRLFVGGAFTKINTTTRSRLAAFDISTTGAITLSTRWNPRPNNTVNALALSPDGKRIYAGGAFTTLTSGTTVTTRNRLAAIDATAPSTGTADPNWNPDANNTVRALALSSDGSRIYAGGDFTTLAGGAVTRNRLAAIDATAASAGTVDTAWNPNANGAVNALALSPDGNRIYAGGAFTTVGGTARNRLAAVTAATGAPDTWNPSANAAVNALALSSDGSRIYAGGDFTSVNGKSRDRVAAVNATTGEVDPLWIPKANSEVHRLALSPDGTRIYAGGGFTRMNSTTRNRLAAVDAVTGKLDLAWAPSVDNVVRALAVVGNKVYFGGDFTTVNGQRRTRLAMVDGTPSSTGSLDPNWVPSARGGEVYAMVPSKDGKRIYAGGAFTLINDVTRLKLAAIDADPTKKGALIDDWRPDPNYQIWNMDVSSTNLYAAGAGIGGNLAAYDVTKPLAPGEFTWKHSADGDYQTVLVRGDKVYAGGHFDKVDKTERHRLVAVDAATGTLDPQWAPPLFGSSTKDRGPWAMTGATGPALHMGGEFQKVAGQVQQGYARFSDSDSTPPTVSSVMPAEGATGVAVATNVEAIFSEAMDEASLTASGAFTLTKEGSSTTITATVSYDPATRKAVLDPSEDLEAGATYTVSIKGGSSGAKDTVGNMLAEDKSWSFATSS